MSCVLLGIVLGTFVASVGFVYLLRPRRAQKKPRREELADELDEIEDEITRIPHSDLVDALRDDFARYGSTDALDGADPRLPSVSETSEGD